MIKIDPGAIGFTSGCSREHKYSTVGEQINVEQLRKLHMVGKQITVEQLIEDHDIQRNDQYIGITSKISRLTPARIYYYYSTHRPLSNMNLEY